MSRPKAKRCPRCGQVKPPVSSIGAAVAGGCRPTASPAPGPPPERSASGAART